MSVGPLPPPSIPFHVAKAYAAGPRSATRPDAASPGSPAYPTRADTLVSDRLVAATVPGRVGFDASGTARPTTDAPGPALPFYTRPGDKNAAATAIAVGRALDLQG
jgi:hypothetical protein